MINPVNATNMKVQPQKSYEGSQSLRSHAQANYSSNPSFTGISRLPVTPLGQKNAVHDILGKNVSARKGATINLVG